jgi:hypothetical protein
MAPTRAILPSRRSAFQCPQDGSLGNAEPGRQFGKGRRTERKIPLKVVEQAKVEASRVSSVVHQKPVRLARLVKKMPLGACTSNSPSLVNVAVS